MRRLLLFLLLPLSSLAQEPPALVQSTDLLVMAFKLELAQPSTSVKKQTISTTEGADDVTVYLTGYYIDDQLRLLLFRRTFEAGMRGFDKQVESQVEFVLHNHKIVFAEKSDSYVRGSNPSEKGLRETQRYYFQDGKLRYYSELGLPEALHDDLQGRAEQHDALMRLFKQCVGWLRPGISEKLGG
ncbi:MAG: hypothetical protein ACOCZ8_02605 [Bacteroidota bacterium]